MIWTEESARWLARAYEYGQAAGTLCDRIVPYLKAHARICDAGCGVGALSLALAARGHDVTALDVSAVALAQLRSCDNPRVKAICGDAREHLPDTPYDAMVFCFFGDMQSCLEMAARCCTGDVFYVSRDYDMHRFSVGAHPVRYRGYRDARNVLDAKSIPYDAAEFALDMGQPFESLEEARRFFALYSRDDPALITDGFLREKLKETGDEQYPLYLPHLRAAGMIHLHVKDIPQPARISDKDQSDKK